MENFVRKALGGVLISLVAVQGAGAEIVCETADWQLGNVPIIVFSGAEGTYLNPTSAGDRAMRHLACIGMDCAGQDQRADLATVSRHYSLVPVGDGSGDRQWLKEVVYQPEGRYWHTDTARVSKFLVTCDR